MRWLHLVSKEVSIFLQALRGWAFIELGHLSYWVAMRITMLLHIFSWLHHVLPVKNKPLCYLYLRTCSDELKYLTVYFENHIWEMENGSLFPWFKTEIDKNWNIFITFVKPSLSKVPFLCLPTHSRLHKWIHCTSHSLF